MSGSGLEDCDVPQLSKGVRCSPSLETATSVPKAACCSRLACVARYRAQSKAAGHDLPTDMSRNVRGHKVCHTQGPLTYPRLRFGGLTVCSCATESYRDME